MTYSISKIKTSIRVDREVWTEFCQETRRRGTSSCHVLETLMIAYLQGMARTKDEHTTVVVNLTMQHVVERPRRENSFESAVFAVKNKPWPPPCEKAETFFKSSGDVGCLEMKDFIKVDKCWRCFENNGHL